MGCDSYGIKTFDTTAQADGECWIHFQEGDEDDSDSPWCLCTFPHNNASERLHIETVRSLALLGAAVVLARLQPTTVEDFFIPRDIPRWLHDGIDSVLSRVPKLTGQDDGA